MVVMNYYLFSSRKMKNLRPLTEAEIDEVNFDFLQRFPSRRLFALLNVNRNYSLHFTKWNLFRDTTNRILGKLYLH
jgi:hypothetical protein